jgi:hypothetical protein
MDASHTWDMDATRLDTGMVFIRVCAIEDIQENSSESDILLPGI